MGSGLLNHLRIAELPPPRVGWAGGGEVSSGEAARGSARTRAIPGQRWHREMLFHSTCVGIWSVSPQAVTEVELLAKSNWMLT